MNVFDIGILAVLGGFLLKGLVRGLLREVCSLLGLVIGCVVALHFHGPLAATMATSFRLPPSFCAVVTFALLFLAVVLIFWGIGFLLTRFVKLPVLGGMNRIIGGFFGLAEAVLLLAVVLYSLGSGALPASLQPAFKRSQLAPPFQTFGVKVFRGGNTLLEFWK